MYSFRLVFCSVIVLLICSACGDSSSATKTNTTSEAVDTSTVSTPTLAEEPAERFIDNEAESTTEARTPAPLPADWPTGQVILFDNTALQGLCDHKYGCIEEEIYPLGWSEDGKFAYARVFANEAVENFRMEVIVQDAETDEIVGRADFNAEKEIPNWSEDITITFAEHWERLGSKYENLLQSLGIQLNQGTVWTAGNELTTRGRDYIFSTNDNKRYNELFDIQVVDKYSLNASVSDDASWNKSIDEATFDKYDLILATRPLGCFESPFEARAAVIVGMEKRGYEGPPNVLQLKVVGCRLD